MITWAPEKGVNGCIPSYLCGRVTGVQKNEKTLDKNNVKDKIPFM